MTKKCYMLYILSILSLSTTQICGATEERLGWINANLSSINGKLGSINDALGTLDNNINVQLTDLNDKLGDNNGTLNDKIGTLNTNLDNTKQALGNLAKLDDINGNLAKLNDINGNLAKLDDINGNLAKLDDINGNLAKLNDINGNLAKLNDINGNLAKLNSALADPSDASGKDNLNENLKALNTNLTNALGNPENNGSLNENLKGLNTKLDELVNLNTNLENINKALAKPYDPENPNDNLNENLKDLTGKLNVILNTLNDNLNTQQTNMNKTLTDLNGNLDTQQTNMNKTLANMNNIMDIQQNELKKLMKHKKIMHEKKKANIIKKDPASALATYYADLKHKEQSNKDLMNELFDTTLNNNFMYSLLPIEDINIKKKYWIRGNISGLNSDKYNTNSVLIGGDIFNKLFSQSLLKLQLLGGTMFGKLYSNSNDYNTLDFLIGPKLSLLHKYFVFEILGLYRHNTIKYSKNNRNEFTSNIFSFGGKLGFNINIANKFVLHPYVHVLVSNASTNKTIKLSNKYKHQVNWAPGLAIGYKVSNSTHIIADYKYNFKPVFVGNKGTDLMNSPNKKGSNEFGLGVNKSFNNSFEFSAKIAVNISKKHNINSNKKYKCDVKLQVQFSKSF